MNTPTLRSAIWLATALLAGGAQAQEVMARVLNSTAVVQQVAVPRQVCTQQPVVQQGQPSGAGAVMGAIAGGAMGNAIGGGSGKDLATAIGLFGGAILGNRIEGSRDEVRNVQQCSTQTTYENRVLHYDVVYEYDGKRYSVKMPNDPGQYVRLQLSPVGVLPSAPAAQPAPATIFTPISSAPAAPTVTYVQPAPVYVPAPVLAAPYPVYPARYGYSPYVAPIGLSLSWSNSHPREFRHGHGHKHWR